MNDEKNNVTDTNTKIPKKKAKWLIGIGVFAVIAVVAGTLVFASNGQWFKGAIFDMPEVHMDQVFTQEVPPMLATTDDNSSVEQDAIDPNLITTSTAIYVDDNPIKANDSDCLSDSNCNYDDDVADGSKSKPYRTIDTAIMQAGSKQATIYVAEGTYARNLSINSRKIDLIGSYNASFTSSNIDSTPSTIKGSVTIKNTTGSLESFKFQEASSNQTFIISVQSPGSNNFTITNNNFSDIDVSNVGINITGNTSASGTITVKNNIFNSVSIRNGSVFEANLVNSIFDSNFLYNCYGKTAIIEAKNNSLIKNNIIANSNENTRYMILVSDGAEIYNNTLAYNNNQPEGAFGLPNPIKKVAIKSLSSEKIYNNLVVENDNYISSISSGGTISAFDIAVSTAHLKNNAIYPESLKTNVKGVTSGTLLSCAPGFSRSSSANGYKLSSTSSCINNGTTISSVTKDYFGTSRPTGAKHDIGAYEYGTSKSTDPLEPLKDDLLDKDVLNDDILPDKDLLNPADNETPEICDDNIDNDNDGDVDCNDSDCDTQASCDDEENTTPEETQEICTNGIDDDGDGYIDCIDWDCNDDAFCTDDSNNETPDPETCTCDWSDLTDDFDGTAAKGLCEMGCIVGGYPDGTVRLNEKLNRAELLAIAFRASKYSNIYEVDNNADYCFNDVTSEAEGHWFAPYICTAKNKGFVEGYAGNLAKPANKVILAEALKMMLGALDENYTINNNGKWYIDMVLDAADENQLPYAVNNSNDADAVGAVELTRGKAFNMLYRILNY